MRASVICCWACGAQEEALLPLSLRASCEACDADWHCCRQCRHFDERRSPACQEPQAERVAVEDRRNRCDFFQPRLHETSDTPSSSAKAQARARLEALFGKKPE